MNDFAIWFSEGLSHILSFGGYDHVLFVCTLVFAYPHREWKKLIGLVLGFTLGHSLSMAFSVLSSFHFSSGLVEVGIALSILFAAVWELLTLKKKSGKSFGILLGTVCFFGLIHGLGFSMLLRSLLSQSDNLILPLLYFNVGLEAGQLIIVVAVLLFSLFLGALINVRGHYIKISLLCIIGTLAFIISAERLFLLFSF